LLDDDTWLNRLLQEAIAPPKRLSLTLLKARILFVDYKQLSFPLHDLAINTSFFNGSSDFHNK
jgi:hypothetical protein